MANHYIDKKGELIAVCGSSGSGKSTLVRYALSTMVDNLDYMKTITTREPRPHEDDVEYTFATSSEYDRMRDRASVWDESLIYGNRYGVNASFYIEEIRKGRNLIFCSVPSSTILDGMCQVYGKITTVHLKTDLETSFERQKMRDGVKNLGRLAVDRAMDVQKAFTADYIMQPTRVIDDDKAEFLKIIMGIIE